jgi:hypothetical protein
LVQWLVLRLLVVEARALRPVQLLALLWVQLVVEL